MIRSKDLQKAKQEIEAFKRKLKISQKRLMRAYENAKPSFTDTELEVLERKEKHFRSMKRKLSEMEEKLRALQECQEPEKIKAWKIRRPSTEASLIMFAEA